MNTTLQVELIVKRYDHTREDAIVDAIEAMDGFYADWDSPARCISAICEAMPDYELDNSIYHIINTIRAANGRHCTVGVVVDELESDAFRRKRRKHRRRQLRSRAA
jgi:hypothetical protein